MIELRRAAVFSDLAECRLRWRRISNSAERNDEIGSENGFVYQIESHESMTEWWMVMMTVARSLACLLPYGIHTLLSTNITILRNSIFQIFKRHQLTNTRANRHQVRRIFVGLGAERSFVIL